MRHLAFSLAIFAACTASAPSRTKQAPVPPTTHPLTINLDKSSDVRAAPQRPVASTDGTIAMQLPGRFPGSIAYANPGAGSDASVVEGMLASDAPLRFLRADGIMRAVSLDASVVYQAHERVTAAAPWSPERSDQGCCAWWENTLWRAAPGAWNAGLLRAVTPPTRDWSVLDWHLPDTLEPAWRVSLTEGPTGVVAAAVSPRADQLVVVLADGAGKSSVRALATRDGKTLWTTDLDRPAAEWRGNEGRVAYSADGARVAVLLADPARCESCSAIAVVNSKAGKLVHTVPVQAIVSPRFASLGLTGNTVWIFEHVTAKQTDMSTRPERCQYEAHDLATGDHHTADQTAPEWGIQACTTWALLPRFGKDGVVGLSLSGSGTLSVLAADQAP